VASSSRTAAHPSGAARRRRTRPPGAATREFVVLAATVAVLLVLGLVMTFSSSFVRSAAETGDAFSIFQRQLFACLAGVPLLVGAALIDYRVWRRVAPLLLLTALTTAVLVLLPSVGVVAYGARRWIALGPVTFQPTELLKLAVPLFLAHVIARRWAQIRAGDLRSLLLPAAPLLFCSALLVMGQPDLESAGLVLAIGGLVLLAAGLPWRILAVGAGAGALAGVVAIVSTEFRRGRIMAWLDPMAYPGDLGYQTVQGYLALGSGGVFGRGLGQGRGQWLYIPNAHTDFIYAIIGEELGLLGALFVLLLFAVVAVLGMRIARGAPDPFGRLVATAITGGLLLQAGMNMGSVVGLLPVTGVTLPLISFGGTSLVLTMLACGILLSIARHVVVPDPPAGPAKGARPQRRQVTRRRRRPKEVAS